MDISELVSRLIPDILDFFAAYASPCINLIQKLAIVTLRMHCEPFKQWLALKMQVRYGLSIVLLLWFRILFSIIYDYILLWKLIV